MTDNIRLALVVLALLGLIAGLAIVLIAAVTP